MERLAQFADQLEVSSIPIFPGTLHIDRFLGFAVHESRLDVKHQDNLTPRGLSCRCLGDRVSQWRVQVLKRRGRHAYLLQKMRESTGRQIIEGAAVRSHFASALMQTGSLSIWLLGTGENIRLVQPLAP